MATLTTDAVIDALPTLSLEEILVQITQAETARDEAMAVHERKLSALRQLETLVDVAKALNCSEPSIYRLFETDGRFERGGPGTIRIKPASHRD